MCGISGIISKDGIKVDSFIKMNQIIRHRGPDDEGFVFFDADLNATVAGGTDTPDASWKSTHNYSPRLRAEECKDEYSIAFGHRRLSILDLSPAGHMPMCDREEQLWITYNGEVYNFIEIREELEQKGYTFSTSSDTEVILTAYKEWGEKCLDKFMGMFALAILDRKANSVFLARDRFGIKPLYYWVSKTGDFYFSSEIKQFTTSEDWRAVLNHQGAYDYIVSGKTDHTNETLFRDVFQLSPGHAAYLDIADASSFGLKTFKWYQPNVARFNGTFKEAKELFRTKFLRSVQLHLRADVKVGCTLSGGLDSSSITCVVNELLKNQGKSDIQNTFSAVDGYTRFSEKKWIEEVLKQVDVKSHFVTPNPEEVLNNLDDIVFQMDEPMGSLSPYLAYLVDRMAKENDITVLLNGQGADEYLGGYGAFRKLQKQKALDSLNIFKIKSEFQNSWFSAFRLASRSLIRKIISRLSSNGQGRTETNSLKNKKWSEYIDTDKLQVNAGTLPKTILNNEKSYQSISEYQLTRSPLTMFLRWEDRNSMIHSIEARVPFLDHRLVEFCHSLPVKFIDSPFQTKRILLEALKDSLPEKIYNRKDKMGYVAPEERWVKKEYTEKFKALLEESVRCSQGILKPNTMEYLDTLISGEERFNYSYWRFIMFGHWMKVFKVSKE